MILHMYIDTWFVIPVQKMIFHMHNPQARKVRPKKPINKNKCAVKMMQEQLQSLMQSEMNIVAREIVKRMWNRQLRPQKP